MKRIKNILVALDLSVMDEKVIKYTSFIAAKLKVENVYFVHNIKKYEISDLFEEHLKDINLDEVIGEELNEKVKVNFKASVNWEVLISEDPYSETLIKYIAEKYQVDLAIVGNKKNERGTGVVSGKLLRLLRCDVLAVPASANEKIDVIWAAIDLSQESRKIFTRTREIQEDNGSILKAVHVYSVPVQFSPYISPEAMEPKVEKHVNEKINKFLNKLEYPHSVEPIIFLGRESGAARKIQTKMLSGGIDLLMVSDKGGNNFSPFAVGTVTEELFNADLDVPLWVVK
ncbi:universal stress protein [Autumnicola musiva]|uniref:Universal stress protein n=1 Tax=Autumnicola musiva TaxID=3075589 RepID=A0ABU3D971_9FLAO|nr:universal stress protein [Zunongwangia sp. F117]MDT0678086.1 universal stress protein [Zunongwangia sp. F117]